MVGSRGVERLAAFEVTTIHGDVNAKVVRRGLVDSRAVVRTLWIVPIGGAPPIGIFQARSSSPMWAGSGRNAATINLG